MEETYTKVARYFLQNFTQDNGVFCEEDIEALRCLLAIAYEDGYADSFAKRMVMKT